MITQLANMVATLSVKLTEPPTFNGSKREGKPWLVQLKRYFSAVGLNVALAYDAN